MQLHDAPVASAANSVNVGRLLTGIARQFPGRTAIRSGDRTITYGEFNQRVDSLARGLSEIGLAVGDRVVIWSHNCPEFLETMFACWKTGLAVVPMNARLTPDEVNFHVRDCAARALVYGAGFGEGAREIEVEHRIGIGSDEDIGYETLADSPAADEPVRDFPEETPAWIFYTSGTTGKPKGAVLTHRNLAFVVVSWCADLYQMQPEDVVLHCAPLSHGAGFHALVGLARGAENIVHGKWDPAVFSADVQRRGVTVSWLVPTQIRMLLDSPALAGADLSSLKCVVYGGSPMYVEDLKEAITRIGPVFCQLFGQGESPMTISYLRREEHRLERSDTEVLASAGVVRTGMEVAIAGTDGKEMSAGEAGEILVRGPAVMAGYWERPEETAEALKGGWLHTGDLGKLDEHGYLYVLDRKKDFIISGGSNVYAREVEDVLLEHPAIVEAAVFGVPDRLWGEAVTAAVVGEGLDPQEVIAYCRKAMADYKCPKRIFVCVALPKNAYGKVLKRQLRERFAGEAGTAVSVAG
ncbi:acyl-CoA synthetase [Amycolatopsis benzoatilytica]|uniref:acyl-CoA synthetase n=1 Tax=Amycolatopsis benzoatilytica TaxID=346045 RepID=UPI0003A7ED6D|nr:long-chain fatty acid--CoA ligase [Amycolatopsis benzoatilytica]